MTKLEKWVLSEMMDKLEDWENREVCLSELAWNLFENENCNGSYWCSYYAAKEWVKEYFDDLGEVVADRLLGESQYIQDNWDESVILTEEVIKRIKDEWQEAMEA